MLVSKLRTRPRLQVFQPGPKERAFRTNDWQPNLQNCQRAKDRFLIVWNEGDDPARRATFPGIVDFLGAAKRGTNLLKLWRKS